MLICYIIELIYKLYKIYIYIYIYIMLYITLHLIILQNIHHKIDIYSI